ncbi:nucleotidyltransferase family protein [Sneathiella sp.]|uniref:nucleotidyltransferase family protein n=1 Tax=Sneathiella sp. TaxID=1964365 RepID=UPI003562C6B8
MTGLPELSQMRAMVLAAGLGTRLRPLTETTPKPLVKVAGKALLDYCLDLLRVADIRNAVVNTHYLGSQIETHVKAVTDLAITISDESACLLETGGGVKKALSLLGDAPFFVLNSDVIVRDRGMNSLARMHDRWNPDEMDALLLLHPTVSAISYEGRGDFTMNRGGIAERRDERSVAPYLFTGVQLLNPALFEGTPEGPFSLNLLYDKAAANGRLVGLRHDGQWLHVGTAAALATADRIIGGS